MNKTKKLTQGAMLVAIIGALMLIDRQLSFIFSTYILLIIPVVIAIYGVMYEIKDALVMCFALLVIGVLFGTLATYIYMPISIIVGLLVSWGIKKGLDRRKINLLAAIAYVISEVLVAFIVFPLCGVSVSSQLASLQEGFNMVAKVYGVAGSLDMMFASVSMLLTVVFVVATVITGVLEGYLTGLLTVLLLKKLKIKKIDLNSPLDIKMPVYLAYILILFCVCGLFAYRIQGLEENYPALVYTLICVAIIASLILAYYGYLFIIIYTNIRTGKQNGLLVLLACVLLFPLSYVILIVVGFLYGAGPLRVYLEKLITQKWKKADKSLSVLYLYT